MGKKLTQEDFERMANEKHNFIYDYSKTIFRGRGGSKNGKDDKVIIICKIHGEFLQSANNHLAGSKCPMCQPNRRLNQEIFLACAMDIHKGYYGYDKVVVINGEIKVIIICPICGDFEQKPNIHLMGSGCPNCSGNQLLTQEIFLERSISKHGYRYNYDKTVYSKSDEYVIITCLKHGDFLQTPSHHMNGTGCPKCGGTGKLTQSEFIERANIRHNYGFDYSKTIYKNMTTEVIIICLNCNEEFLQTPRNHLQHNGCNNCVVTKKKTTEQWIKEANAKHNFRYDYSQSVYINDREKILIICYEHGPFWQIAGGHIIGQGCIKCAGLNKKTAEEFINQANLVHNFLYNYNKTEYDGLHKKLLIICKIHGDFWQTAKDHLAGNGCPSCHTKSNGEKRIIRYLNDFNITYRKEFTFKDLKDIKALRFDFAIFDDFGNIVKLIEYQGVLHFKPRNSKDPEKMKRNQAHLEKTQRHDQMKRDYCKEHGYDLLEIHYKEFKNLDTVLAKELADWIFVKI